MICINHFKEMVALNNCWVFRVEDQEPGFSAVRSEIKEGRARQGWHPSGADIRLGYEAFLKAWIAKGWPIYEDNYSLAIGARRRFDVLKKMLNIRPGDRLIIPRVSVDVPGNGNYFTLATVTEPYNVVGVLNSFNDFGSVIGVDKETLCSYDYDENDMAAEIALKLNGLWPYGAAVSRIGDTNGYIRGYVDKLIAARI